MTPELRRKLHVANLSVSKLYCVPKIHQTGKTLGPIVSAVGSPTFNVAQWITKAFENVLNGHNSFCVKNRLN